MRASSVLAITGVTLAGLAVVLALVVLPNVLAAILVGGPPAVTAGGALAIAIVLRSEGR